MKAWIFGDSFVDGRYKTENDFSRTGWLDKIFEYKNIEYVNHSVSGQSNEGIFLSVIDCLDAIQSEDVVVISWSSNLRFLNLDESLNEFDRYINSHRHHYDIWKKSDTIDLHTISKLHNHLSSDLKFSICVNGMKSILKEKKVKFKFINGHYDFNPVNDVCAQYFPISKYRSYHPNIQKYFDKEIFIRFDNGYCLLNEFFLCQLQHVINLKSVEKIINRSHNMVGHFDHDKFERSFLRLIDDEGVRLFVDNWHLNATGHEIFANKVKHLIIEQLNL
jgi:hypothetical protein